jgi:NAD(P)-dependent dehydrogenase (short-subunit alcohol dehydrogenase family)
VTAAPAVPGVLNRFSLHGKVVLVTGGSRGLGRSMSSALGEVGAAVAVTARSAEAAEVAAAELVRAGVQAVGVPLEVTDPADVERAVEAVTAALGPIDVLVNNAGAGVVGPALAVGEDVWRDVFATNVDGVWHCCRTVGRGMVERGSGVIVNVSSVLAEIVNAPRWQSSYLASKAAVNQLTKALAAEWAPAGIRVNALAPGYFRTDMSPVDEPGGHAWSVEPAALKRVGNPDELGPAVVFLASEASSFMTGSVLTVDGGISLR